MIDYVLDVIFGNGSFRGSVNINSSDGTTAGFLTTTNGVGTQNGVKIVAGRGEGRIVFEVNKTGADIEAMTIRNTGFVGIGTNVPNSRLDVDGSIGTAINKTNIALTLDEKHRTILANAFTAGFAITLPAPSTCQGREYVIRKTDESSNAITFTFTGITGSNAIRVSDTSATAGQYINSLNYTKTLRIQSDGTNWVLID